MLPAHGARPEYSIIDVLHTIKFIIRNTRDLNRRFEDDQHLKQAVINLHHILCDAIELAPIQDSNPEQLRLVFDIEICNDVSSFLHEQLTNPNDFTVPRDLLVSLSDAIDETMNNPKDLFRLGNRVLKGFYPSPALLVKLLSIHPIWQLTIGFLILLIIEFCRLWLTIKKTSGHALIVYFLKSLFMSLVWYLTDFCFTLFSMIIKAPSWLCYLSAIFLPQFLINLIKFFADTPKIRHYFRGII